jgi:hypothetical protein
MGEQTRAPSFPMAGHHMHSNLAVLSVERPYAKTSSAAGLARLRVRLVRAARNRPRASLIVQAPYVPGDSSLMDPDPRLLRCTQDMAGTVNLEDAPIWIRVVRTIELEHLNGGLALFERQRQNYQQLHATFCKLGISTRQVFQTCGMQRNQMMAALTAPVSRRSTGLARRALSVTCFPSVSSIVKSGTGSPTRMVVYLELTVAGLAASWCSSRNVLVLESIGT